MIRMLMGVAVLGLAAGLCWAQGGAAPSATKAGAAETAAAAADTAPVAPAVPAVEPAVPAPAPVAAPPAPKTSTVQDQAINTIKLQIEKAEKILKLADAELAKPEEKRDMRKVLSWKLSAAQAYQAAANAAKRTSAQMKKDDQPAFLEQYEQPNREKAIALYLELAAVAKEKKSYPDAVSMYRTVLQIDAKNETALAGMKAIQDEFAAAAAAKKNPGVSGGGTGTNKDTILRPWEQQYKGDYTNGGSGRPDWGHYGW
jgi:hypothetical protein